MESEKKPTEKIMETARRLVDNYRDLATLNVVEHASLAASWSSLGTALLILLIFVLLFAGLGSAWWLGESMNNIKAGFFIVSGFYLLLIVAALLSLKKVVPGIRNMFIRLMYGKNN
jgi:uncharacterized membrane protein